MATRQAPTSFDNKIASSPFAKTAEQDAMRDAELAGQVGWWLHLTTNYVRHEKLGDDDFDALAEKLLLREAEVRYPVPTADSQLRAFYAGPRRQACGQADSFQSEDRNT